MDKILFCADKYRMFEQTILFMSFVPPSDTVHTYVVYGDILFISMTRSYLVSSISFMLVCSFCINFT